MAISLTLVFILLRAAISHYELGRELRGLRRKGVLILGSGNILPILREVGREDTVYDWVREFDAKMKDLIL